MILSFPTDRSGQTVQNQISLLLDESKIRAYTGCNSVCIIWMHYFMKKPPCLNFRVFTASFSGVQIFRIFTAIQFWTPVLSAEPLQCKCLESEDYHCQRNITIMILNFRTPKNCCNYPKI